MRGVSNGGVGGGAGWGGGFRGVRIIASVEVLTAKETAYRRQGSRKIERRVPDRRKWQPKGLD